MARITQQLLLLYLVAVVPAVLTDLAPGTFKFVRKPSDAEVEKGSPHTIYCTVSPSNMPDIEYTWYKFKNLQGWDFKLEQIQSQQNNDVNIVDGMNSSQLFIRSADESDAGFYMCKVSTSKYTIMSDSAHITVLRFDVLPLQTRNDKISGNVEKVSIKCDVPNSNSLLTIQWYRVGEDGDVKVQDERMFVVPFQKNQVNNDDLKLASGSLVIVNVNAADAGVYKCKTTYKGKTYELSEVTVTVANAGNSINTDNKFFYASPEDITAIKGSDLSLYCAIQGKPLGTIQWYKNTEDTALVTADTITVDDFNRHLLIANVQEKDKGLYFCLLSHPKRRKEVLIKVQEEQQNNIQVLESPTSFVLKPNFYSPSELNCLATQFGSTRMLIMKNTSTLQTSSRVKLEKPAVKDGTIQRKLALVQATESDLGVYQCFIYNETNVFERTAYITLEKDEVTLDRSSDAEYLYVGDAKTVAKAEEYCRNDYGKGRIGHLVSIMSQEENDKVRALAELKKDKELRIINVWIGLTKEYPFPPGKWKWLHPGDSSSVHSNWEEEKPYDVGYADYAVMNIDTGKWFDVSNKEKHPFVCKRYNTFCPTVYSFYDERLRIRGWEDENTKYHAGERVQVYCSDVVTKINIREVTCKADGTFSVPKEKIEKLCPSSACSVFMNLFPFTVSVVLLLFLS